MKRWFWIGAILVWAGCAGAPVNPQDVENARPEARTIMNKYGVGCQSMGWPANSPSYFNCVINFYQQENPDAGDRRNVLIEAMKKEAK